MKTYDEIITYEIDKNDPKKASFTLLYEELTTPELKTITEFFKRQKIANNIRFREKINTDKKTHTYYIILNDGIDIDSLKSALDNNLTNNFIFPMSNLI